jgi:hypothetical protein
VVERFPWWPVPCPADPAPERPDPVVVVCPACGWAFETPPSLNPEIRDDYGLPGHAGQGSSGLEPCWAGGWSMKDVRVMVEMRTADGGRLLRAAHP